MAPNLISSIMQFVTPDLIAKIASALGMDRNAAQKAVGGAIPAILASLTGLASKPGGAQQLSNALAQNRPEGLDSLVKSIGSPAQTTRAEEGTDMLSTLMGGGGMNALTSAIGSYAGISPGKSQTLLGLLGPMVMGALGQQQRKAGLDTNELAAAMVSQKDQIAAAMPQGLTDQLRGSGFMDTLDRTFRSGRDAASSAASATAQRAEQMGDAAIAASRRAAAAPSQGISTWPLWLAALAVLAGLGWYFLRDWDGTQMAGQTPPASPAGETTGRAPANVSVADLTGQVTNTVGTMRSTLQGITDPASAKEALPRLQQMNADLDRINSTVSQLPPDSRKAVTDQIATTIPVLKQLWDQVLAIPGVAAIAKPVIDAMRTKLEAMSRA